MFDGATSKCSATVRASVTPRGAKSARFAHHPAYDHGKVRRRRRAPLDDGKVASSSTVTGVEASGTNLSETTRISQLLQQIPSTGNVAYASRSKSGTPPAHVTKCRGRIVSRLLQDNPAAGHDSEAMEAPDPGHPAAFPPPTIPPPRMPLPVAVPIPPPGLRPPMGQEILRIVVVVEHLK